MPGSVRGSVTSPVSADAAAVNGLLSGKIELAWLDGPSTLRAEAESKGYCWPMFTREEDLKNKSYFIANKAAKIPKSAEFPMALAGKKFTFGSATSTRRRAIRASAPMRSPPRLRVFPTER